MNLNLLLGLVSDKTVAIKVSPRNATKAYLVYISNTPLITLTLEKLEIWPCTYLPTASFTEDLAISQRRLSTAILALFTWPWRCAEVLK